MFSISSWKFYQSLKQYYMSPAHDNSMSGYETYLCPSWAVVPTRRRKVSSNITFDMIISLSLRKDWINDWRITSPQQAKSFWTLCWPPWIYRTVKNCFVIALRPTPPPLMVSGFWLYAQGSHKRVFPRAGHTLQNLLYHCTVFVCVCLWHNMPDEQNLFLLVSSVFSLEVEPIACVMHNCDVCTLIGNIVIVKWELFQYTNFEFQPFIDKSKQRAADFKHPNFKLVRLFSVLTINIAIIANAVEVTLWLSVTNSQCHD